MTFVPVSLWVSPCFFIFIGTPVFGYRVHSTLVWLHLNLSTSAKILFPNKVTFSGLGLQGIFLKDMIQLTIGPEISLRYFVCVLLWGAESSYIIIELLTDRLTEARTIHFLVMFSYKQSLWLLLAGPECGVKESGRTELMDSYSFPSSTVVQRSMKSRWQFSGQSHLLRGAQRTKCPAKPEKSAGNSMGTQHTGRL